MPRRFAFCLLLVTVHALAGPYEDGVAAFQQGKFDEALTLWRPLADEGNVAAQFNLAVLYAKGLGVAQDHVQAARWYLKAAEQGDTEAQFTLGNLYETGRGVAQDFQQARRWYAEVIANPRSDAGSSTMKDRARKRLVDLPRTSEEMKYQGGRFVIVRSQDGTCVVAIQGLITRDASVKFEDVVKRTDELGCKTRSLLLESPGGALFDGLGLGREVRYRGFHTVTRYDCASACAMIFLGGAERTLVGSRARIGLHQPATVRVVGNERRCSTLFDSNGVRETRSYLRWVLAAEEADQVMALIMQTSCDAITWERGQRALELGIATKLESETVDLFGPIQGRR